MVETAVRKIRPLSLLVIVAAMAAASGCLKLNDHTPREAGVADTAGAIGDAAGGAGGGAGGAAGGDAAAPGMGGAGGGGAGGTVAGGAGGSDAGGAGGASTGGGGGSPSGAGGAPPPATGGVSGTDTASPPSSPDTATVCTPGQTRCAANNVSEICIGTGWTMKETCPRVCVVATGACGGDCKPGEKRCGSDQTPETCGAMGTWERGTKCSFMCTGTGTCSGCAADGECTGGQICVSNRCAAPKCGDGRKSGAEKCDDTSIGKTDLGSCAPDCSGEYSKKFIRHTQEAYRGNLGGPAGADKLCQAKFGANYKALIVGGGRRATVTPRKGDGQTDWVLRRWAHYHNQNDQLLWRTDDVALLGIRDGQRQNLFAGAWPETEAYDYPWAGFDENWVTVAENYTANEPTGTCAGWTTDAPNTFGTFPMVDLRNGSFEPCGSAQPLLCVEQ